VDNSVFVPAASAKWQVTDWLALRATGGKSFSQVNPPPAVGPTITGNASAPTALGGTAVLFTSANYPNTDVKPERGVNYHVGAIIQIGAFQIFGRRVFRMAPIHHHFELGGWPETTVIVRFWILAGLFTALGLGFYYADFLRFGAFD